jgi:putative transposase
MSRANRCWGSPRIVGELQKLGIEVAKSTVERYMLRRRKPPTATWRAFLSNHVKDLVAIDFFVVPTVSRRRRQEVSCKALRLGILEESALKR